MLSFSGMEKCSLDVNGRLKLPPRFIEDFRERGSDPVLHCLPEGAVAFYPEDIYLAMRSNESNPAVRAGESMLVRRRMRQFGALSQTERISPQGRITLPPLYRQHAGLDKSTEVILVGVEIGIEIWSCERWKEEQVTAQDYLLEKGRREMESDLEE